MKTLKLTVIELRQYTVKPGRRAELIELFEREFIETQNAVGCHVLGIFCDAQREDRFVWLRGFTDMAARQHGLQTFYGGPVWQAHRSAANATMLDSSDVLLLRPLTIFPAPSRADGQAWQAVVCPLAAAPNDALRDALRRDASIGWLETEAAANTFPALPVREGEWVVVGLTPAGDTALVLPDELQAYLTADVQHLRLLPTPRSPLR